MLLHDHDAHWYVSCCGFSVLAVADRHVTVVLVAVGNCSRVNGVVREGVRFCGYYELLLMSRIDVLLSCSALGLYGLSKLAVDIHKEIPHTDRSRYNSAVRFGRARTCSCE